MSDAPAKEPGKLARIIALCEETPYETAEQHLKVVQEKALAMGLHKGTIRIQCRRWQKRVHP